MLDVHCVRVRVLIFGCSRCIKRQSLKEGDKLQLVLRSTAKVAGQRHALVPESHTCFKQMILPDVHQQEEMEAVVGLAVSHWSEFGYDTFE